MNELLNLGKLYPSDFLKSDEKPRSEPIELKIIMDNDGIPRLETIAPKEIMWGKYWYHSGGNTSMKNSLKDVVDSILPLVPKANKILDIASNDGTLLSFIPKSWIRVGIDPSNGDIHESAKEYGTIVQDYFSKEAVSEFGKFDVITIIAMFYDVENPIAFCKEVYEVLDDEGLLVIQMSYTPLMLRQLAVDNICHEHVAYHSYTTMSTVLDQAGFKIMDCTLNETNGGSFRLFIRKKISHDKNFGTQPMRDVAMERCLGLRALELLQSPYYLWEEFKTNVGILKKQVYDFIKSENNRGKLITGYGASTKGNTLLQYFGLDSFLISGIADRNHRKHGLFTVGTNIKIISEERMREIAPDYLLVLPWHFISEIIERERPYLHGKTKLIVPMPKFEIIDL